MSEVDVQLLTRQGAPITGLPDANVTAAHWVLSESGDSAFTIDPLAPGANQIKLWDTEIQIWWDGKLGWNGIPHNFSGGPRGVTVACEGVLSWLKKRFVDRLTLAYGTPTALLDQFVIAWDLVAYAQDESFQGNRNFRLDAASPLGLSGVGRSAVYKRQEHACLYDLLQEFRKFYQGIDFDVRLTGDGHRFFTPYYPRKGVARPEYHMIFRSDGENRNMASFAWQVDGMSMCTQDYSTGGSVKDQKIEENFEDLDASSRHGLLQAITSQGSQLDRPWLLAQARGEVAKRKEPLNNITVTSVRTPDLTMFGTLDTGDWIPVSVDYGMIQEEDWRRVVGITWNPNDSLTVDLGEVVVP